MKLPKFIEPLPNPAAAGMNAYLTGLAFSLALSAGAFVLVWAYLIVDGELMSRTMLLALLSLFAAMQVLVQVTYFLHVTAERQARLTLLSTLFTLLILVIIVVGSLWIMHNLDYNMMPQDVEQYVQDKENIHRPPT